MSLPLYQIDSFTSRPFAGNPAGVVFLDRSRPDDWLKAVAREMNLSETAFLLPENDAWRLRWFTPAVEVTLCGHATLASAHALWESSRLAGGQAARFDTLSGRLTCTRAEDGWITMDFPAKPVSALENNAGLAEALGATPVFVANSHLDLLVELEDERTVRELAPDIPHLKSLPARGVIVTSRSDSLDYQFVSRFFAPAVGVDEDPVTGSAHCCLAPFWASRLGQNELTGYQASARGGFVRVAMRGDRVLLSGQAVTIFSAQLQDTD